ncbi:hypothetical protein [Cyclobacterium jeungdonense]|uniref:ECF transporter S component n=1 Tax=Cyclobacterium jeungdonense TaxID=708087 RepID=A0ABT8CEB3_9BACT|nr:hypothetical protein [Cyclobacterium jeungdonense]MDN3690402.1 hypothetical protein [Cyclobacterium jeungdonense]
MIDLIKHQYKTSPTWIMLMTVVVAVLFPIVVHLGPPVQGSPLGAILLPMFYVPLVALILIDKVPALVAAALSPTLNFLISGNEQWSLLILLSLELIVFTLVISDLFSRKISFWAVVPGILLAKLAGAGLIMAFGLLPLSPVNYFIQSLYTGLPGILILLVLSFLLKVNTEKERML